MAPQWQTFPVSTQVLIHACMHVVFSSYIYELKNLYHVYDRLVLLPIQLGLAFAGISGSNLRRDTE